MAYDRRIEGKSHDYKRFLKELKSRELGNVILLYGREEYLKRWAADEVKSSFINEAMEVFDFTRLEGDSVSQDEILKACETLPLMSDKRVVLVKNFSLNSGLGGQDGGNKSFEITEDYLKNFPKDTILILMYNGMPDKRRKFFKDIKKYGSEYDFSSLDRSTLVGFIKKQFMSLNCTCSDDILYMISDFSGYLDKETNVNLDSLLNDIKAISAHSDGNIREEDVLKAMTRNSQVYIFDFTDALLDKRHADALAMLRKILDSGENEFRLLGMICSQLETLLLACEMYEAGYNYKDAALKLKIHEYRVKLAYQRIVYYNSKMIRKLLMDAYSIDRNVKTGAMGVDLALEIFVSRI